MIYGTSLEVPGIVPWCLYKEKDKRSIYTCLWRSIPCIFHYKYFHFSFSSIHLSHFICLISIYILNTFLLLYCVQHLQFNSITIVRTFTALPDLLSIPDLVFNQINTHIFNLSSPSTPHLLPLVSTYIITSVVVYFHSKIYLQTLEEILVNVAEKKECGGNVCRYPVYNTTITPLLHPRNHPHTWAIQIFNPASEAPHQRPLLVRKVSIKATYNHYLPFWGECNSYSLTTNSIKSFNFSFIFFLKSFLFFVLLRVITTQEMQKNKTKNKKIERSILGNVFGRVNELVPAGPNSVPHLQEFSLAFECLILNFEIKSPSLPAFSTCSDFWPSIKTASCCSCCLISRGPSDQKKLWDSLPTPMGLDLIGQSSSLDFGFHVANSPSCMGQLFWLIEKHPGCCLCFQHVHPSQISFADWIPVSLLGCFIERHWNECTHAITAKTNKQK
ncbi:hypothetical protein VP01_3680g1 [Puccinia sorghi]|uniref:Uncharacterized protein n=1 Tax=Puccinia sorghi TaxID=27349 RepID=A0A0L6UW97_9BASI|nr:hypothetical protein VP01_3680g1 [Puccinia sorghi]